MVELITAEIVAPRDRSFGLYEFAALPRVGEQVVIWPREGKFIATVEYVEHRPCALPRDGDEETIARQIERKSGPKITLYVKVTEYIG